MTHEELLTQARAHIWAAWTLSSEELASQAVETLIGLGMLVPEGGAQELERLRVRVAELESGLPAMQTALFLALDRVTELETERHATNQALADVTVAQRAAERGSAAGSSVRESTDGLTRLFPPSQALREEEAVRRSVDAQFPVVAAFLAEGAPSQAVSEVEAADEQPPLTVFRASRDSIVLGLYTNAEAARAHCEAEVRRATPAAVMQWAIDEDDTAIADLGIEVDGRAWSTGYFVTGLELASVYDEGADE